MQELEREKYEMPGSNLPSSEFVQIKAPAECWFGKIEPPGQGMSTEQCEIIFPCVFLIHAVLTLVFAVGPRFSGFCYYKKRFTL